MLTVLGQAMPPTPPAIIDRIREIEARIRPHEHSLKVEMEHVLHAGMYARTCRLGAPMLITSVLIKIPTVLIVNGKCSIFAGQKWHQLEGYNVIAASAGRKQIYVTMEPTEITMTFPTAAKTLAEAEAQFTDEAASLLSRRSEAKEPLVVTGQ
jgi:hypothetical protein